MVCFNSREHGKWEANSITDSIDACYRLVSQIDECEVAKEAHAQWKRINSRVFKQSKCWCDPFSRSDAIMSSSIKFIKGPSGRRWHGPRGIASSTGAKWSHQRRSWPRASSSPSFRQQHFKHPEHLHRHPRPVTTLLHSKSLSSAERADFNPRKFR